MEYLDETQIELEGLKHIDLRITPPPRPLDTNRDKDFTTMSDPIDNDVLGNFDRKTAEDTSISVRAVDKIRHESYPRLTGPSTLAQENNDDQQQSNLTAEQSDAKIDHVEPQGILKRYRKVSIAEPLPLDQSTTSLSRDRWEIPPKATWTKINRILVNPEALEQAGERFEEREDSVIVLRILGRDEIELLAERTRIIRKRRDRTRHERAKRRRHKRSQQRVREGERLEKRAQQQTQQHRESQRYSDEEAELDPDWDSDEDTAIDEE